MTDDMHRIDGPTAAGEPTDYPTGMPNGPIPRTQIPDAVSQSAIPPIASSLAISGDDAGTERHSIDDYTAKMTELIELMRMIGNDTQQCEVKECKRRISSTITDTLSAFSNGSGGWIILGLSEKSGFAPVDHFDARAMQEALSQACEKMTPVVRPVIVTCPFEGANLVFARIDEMLPRDKPCFTTALGPHGGSFIRTGDGDRRMTSYEVDRLIEEHLQPTYDLDIVPGATIDDLDHALVSGLLARVREQHPHVFSGSDDARMLLDLQVLRHDDSDDATVGGVLRPTLAGLLALGRYPQKYYPRLSISIAVFPGIDRDEVFRGDERLVAAKTIVGPIPVMINDAVESLMRWIGAKKPDYPPVVLREAIANALTHRDYSPDARGTQVRINVFTNRIEITNPGGLYGTVTHDVLANPHPVTGVPFVSTRNQFLFTLLESTPYPDGGFVNPEGGDGYQRIAASLREAGVEPATTRNDINTFTMTITKHRTAANSTPSDISKAIMTVLERHSAMSIKEIIRELQLTPLAATSGMRELIRERRVAKVRLQDDPTQRYRLKSN
ncbi:putative transcriptional regulator [Bifidobacterium reuteri DSM 23975]|uniref:Putative transcriptional regulator n=2 Tax=Bifidobacterium TaxID=1678 RepID=A0A087CV60_9BIFI|nr:putative transcriptional regulator [Bifidobacterium reuteri DSM 23975]